MDASQPVPTPQTRLCIERFEIAKEIGRGKFGHVYLARERRTKFVVALKVLYKAQIEREKQERQFRREIEIQAQLSHPNILRLYSVFHDLKRIFIVLEFAGQGELYRHLKNAGRFTEARSALYIRQIADALQYMHAHHIIHRDIKPENLLLDHEGNIKLCDFGWSVFSPMDARRETLCGTPDYIAPEMVEKKTHDSSLDLWCVGVLLYEFLVGQPPFQSKSLRDTFARIRRVRWGFPDDVVMSDEARHLIQNLLLHDSHKRLTATQVLAHPFVLKYPNPEVGDGD